MAPLDSFIQLGTNKAGEPVLPEYAFTLCIPGSWPFPSSMDKTILPETYFTEGNPGEEGANTITVAKKTRKCKGKKTQNRSKSARTASSALEASPARAKTTTQIDEERAKQVIQDLHLSSDGSDSEVLDDTGNPSKGANPEGSGPDPPGPPVVPDPEPSIPPGIPSRDQLLDNGQDKPVPPQPDVNTPDPDASASNPLPKPDAPDWFSIPDSSERLHCGYTQAHPGCTSGSRSGYRVSHVPAGDQFVTLLTQTTAHAGGNPHANSCTSIMEGLKEVCGMMTTWIPACMFGCRGNSAKDVRGSHTAKL